MVQNSVRRRKRNPCTLAASSFGQRWPPWQFHSPALLGHTPGIKEASRQEAPEVRPPLTVPVQSCSKSMCSGHYGSGQRERGAGMLGGREHLWR